MHYNRSTLCAFLICAYPPNHLERHHSSREETHSEAKPTGKPVSHEKGRRSSVAIPTGPDEGIFVCFSPSCPNPHGILSPKLAKREGSPAKVQSVEEELPYPPGGVLWHAFRRLLNTHLDGEKVLMGQFEFGS